MPACYAYLRTSSLTNVGEDKDSGDRQGDAIQRYADAHDLSIAHTFYDAGVRGSDALTERKGFSELLDAIEANGITTVIVESADRLARTIMVQEASIMLLLKRGVTVITASGHDLTNNADPAVKMLRQILGVFAEYEKDRLIHKLKRGRDRKLEATGKCGGRKSYTEIDATLVDAAWANHLRGMSLRENACELQARGFVNRAGRAYSPTSISRMIEQHGPR